MTTSEMVNRWTRGISDVERLPVGACELRAAVLDFYTSDFIEWCDEDRL